MVGAVAAKVFVSNMHLMANRLDDMPPKAIVTYSALGQTILEIENLEPLAKPHHPGTFMKKAKVDN